MTNEKVESISFKNKKNMKKNKKSLKTLFLVLFVFSFVFSNFMVLLPESARAETLPVLTVDYLDGTSSQTEGEQKGEGAYHFEVIHHGTEVVSAAVAKNSSTTNWEGQGSEYADMTDCQEVMWKWIYTSSGVLTISGSDCLDEPVGQCELKLTKNSNVDSVEPGEEMTYHLGLENIGDADCTGTGVLIRDYFDPNTVYVSSSKDYKEKTDQYVQWNVGTLKPGDEVEIDLVMLVLEETECDLVLTNKVKYWSNQTGWGEYVTQETIVECQPDNGWQDICGFQEKENRIIVEIDQRLRSDKEEEEAVSSQIPVNIPAGTYDIWLAASDGHENRSTQNQPNEKYFLKLLDSAKDLVAQTDSTSDLDNDVDFTYLEEKVNADFVLEENISYLVAHHAVYPDKSSANSLNAVCAAFDLVVSETSQVTLCKKDDQENKLGGWELSLNSSTTSQFFSGTTADKCDLKGCVVFEDVPYGTYQIEETMKEGWENVSGLGEVTVDQPEMTSTVINKEKEEEEEKITLVAYKVVCEEEEDLPNWGKGGDKITSSTAQDWVDQSDNRCWLQEDWYFEWAEEGTKNPGDNIIGPAGGDWQTFGPTDSIGKAVTTIESINGNYFWVREVMKEGYVPFSGTTGSPHDDVSAEFYCHIDVLNYDNYDRVDNPEPGNVYYCVGFNAPLEKIVWHNVTFMDGDDVYATTSVKHGATTTLPADPVKSGYIFKGWSFSPTSTVSDFDENTVIVEDVTVYAVWKEKETEDVFFSLTATTTGFGFITSDPEGIDCGDSCQAEFPEGVEVTLTAQPGGGQKFDGWGGDCSEEETNVCVLTMDADKEVTAHFITIPGITFVVTFDGNGGIPTSTEITVLSGETVDPLPGATRDGHSFVEWNTQADSQGDQFTSTTTVDADITVYAIWSEVTSFTVTFKGNGGTPETQTRTVLEGDSVDSLPSVSKSGYNFIEWNTQLDGKGTKFTVTTKVTGDITVYAIWQRRSGGSGRITIPVPEPEVLGEEVEIECGKYLFEHIKYGANNNPIEVQKLQVFLNHHMGSNLAITGIYDLATMNVVDQFQLLYKEEVLQPWVDADLHCDVNEPTGYVYKTTKRWINLIMCPTLDIPMPDFSVYEKVDCTDYVAKSEVLGEETLIPSDPSLDEDPSLQEEIDEEIIDLEDPLEDELLEEVEQEDREFLPILIAIAALVLIGILTYYFSRKAKKV